MVAFNITVTGPDPDSRIAKAADSAAANWAKHLAGDAVIEVALTVKPLSGNAIAQAWSPLYYADGPDMPYRSSSAEELRSGTDLTPDGPDMFIDVDPVKSAGTDLVSVFEHEIFHGLGMAGIFDHEHLTDFETIGESGEFTGSAAMAIYGAPVPVSGGHYTIAGLMNPTYDAARHPHIGVLDLAILSDIGVPIVEKIGTIHADSLSADPAGQEVFGGFGADSLSGRAGADTLHGGPGNDSIRGGKSDDVLYGSSGSDTIRGDLGNDTLSGGTGSDLFCFGDSDGYDVIRDFEFNLGGTSDRLQFASEPTVSVDYESYSVTYKAGGTTVVLEHFISIIPDVVTVA